MGYFRFRRRIKIAPGVHWNIGKKGSSLSLGGRGFSHTIGPQGSRTTIGIPGTGVSYTHVQPHSRPATTPTPPPLTSASPPNPATPMSASPPNPLTRRLSRIFYTVGFIMLGIWFVSKLSEQNGSISKPASSQTRPTPSASVLPGHYGVPPANPNSPTVPRAIPVKPSDSPTVLRAIPVEPTAPPASASTTPLIALYRVVNNLPGGFLNLREGPDSTSRAVVRIHAGTGGIRIGESRRNGPTFWRKISVGPYTGWVNQDYLEAENPTP
jgi:hypothetical protein